VCGEEDVVSEAGIPRIKAISMVAVAVVAVMVVAAAVRRSAVSHNFLHFLVDLLCAVVKGPLQQRRHDEPEPKAEQDARPTHGSGAPTENSRSLLSVRYNEGGWKELSTMVPHGMLSLNERVAIVEKGKKREKYQSI
jgi:hypothetical protein